MQRPGDPNEVAGAGDLAALIITEGDPDRVALHANDEGAASCTEMLGSMPEGLPRQRFRRR